MVLIDVSAILDDSAIKLLERFLITNVMDVCAMQTNVLDVYIIFFSVNVDDQNDKDVVDVGDVTVSLFKEAHPDDSETRDMIGLSSEDEAEDLSEDEYIGRKYHRKELPAPPLPPTNPEPPVPPVPPPQQEVPVPVTSIQVPIAMLQGVHQALGQLLQGQTPQLPSLGQPTPRSFVDPSSSSVPFPIPKVKKTDKECPICKRSFWAPETFRRHLKTHTGTQHNVCPNEGCGRKVSSKRSLEVHLTTC